MGHLACLGARGKGGDRRVATTRLRPVASKLGSLPREFGVVQRIVELRGCSGRLVALLASGCYLLCLDGRREQVGFESGNYGLFSS